jgi:hypothetical protein
MKKSVMIILALIFVTTSFGKNKIEGKIIDSSDKSAIQSATVALLSKDSTTMAAGTTTDAAGYFMVKTDEIGNFVLRISYLGYKTMYINITNLSGDLALGNLAIEETYTSLNGITVEGSKVVRKIDRQIIIPTESQKKASSNGMALLKNLHLSRLNINPMDNSISLAGGESVQLRINGKEVTKTEVTALHPSEIVRVEYIDNPGLRYNGTGAVVNYIVNHRANGGNVSGDFTNGLSILGYGEYTLSAKYNTAKSEVSANAYLGQRNITWTRENNESFDFANNKIENEEMGNPTKVKYADGYFSVAYTHFAKQGSMTSITLSDRLNDTPNSISDRESSLMQSGKTYNVVDKTSSHSNSPSLDIYYQLLLCNKQKLYFDFVGTYMNNNTSRRFSMTGNGMDNNVFSAIDGEKYSVIGEGIYENIFPCGTLTTGLKHTQSYLKNKYSGDDNTTVNMTTAETYGFVEWKSSLNAIFDYTVGIGAMNTYNSQGDASQSKLIFRPTISLSRSFGKHWFARYNGYISAYAPSLSALNDVTQTIDAYQKRKGNPNLKTVTFVSNTLSLNFNNRYVQVELFGRYSCDDKPIMESSYISDNYVIRTSENQYRFHRLNLMSTITILPWGEHLMIKLTPFMNRYISCGNDYTHTHTNWGMRGSLLATFGKWAFMAEMNTSEHILWGETLTKSEKLHEIKIGYNEKLWSIGIGVINPFSKYYDQTIDNLSKIAPSRQYAYSTKVSQVFTINLSFNLDFGKARQSQGKRINNKDTENGILTGTK